MEDNTYQWGLSSRDTSHSLKGCTVLSIEEFRQMSVRNDLKNVPGRPFVVQRNRRAVFVECTVVNYGSQVLPSSSRRQWNRRASSNTFVQRPSSREEVHPSDLAIYCGTIATDDGKEKKAVSKFGFIVMDANNVLFGILCGNKRVVLRKIAVYLPKKHERGGHFDQFLRLLEIDYLLRDLAEPGARINVIPVGEQSRCVWCSRMENTTVLLRLRRARHGAPLWGLCFGCLETLYRIHYVRNVAETAVRLYITNDEPNVTSLILAGTRNFPTELNESNCFDPRLQAKVLKLINLQYGGEIGFNQAIEEVFIQEKKLLERFFVELAEDTGKYCFGVDNTLKALEMGVVDTLIVCENLDIGTYLCNRSFGGDIVKITGHSWEGAQFRNSFGGIGGILSCRVDFPAKDFSDNEGIDDSDEDY